MLEYSKKKLSGKENNELKEIYKVFLDKVTFDKKIKEVTVHMVFAQDII